MERVKYFILVLVIFSGINTLKAQTGTWVNKNGVLVESSEAGTISPSIPSTTAPLMVPGSTLINFDDIYAPSGFALTVPASNQYADEGVTFSGSGFSILNEEGNFGVSGYSSPNFLAWNTSLTSQNETITFSAPVFNVSFLAASGAGANITAQAFDSHHNSLGLVNATISSVAQLIELPYVNIATVEISVSNNSAGVIDDLMVGSSSAVPFPIWSVVIGFLLIATFIAVRFFKA